MGHVRKLIPLAVATVCFLSLVVGVQASPLPPIPEFKNMGWGASLSAVERELHRKLIGQKTPEEYDGGVVTIYGVPAKLTAAVGAIDGLREVYLRINSKSAHDNRDQLNLLHGHLEADLGPPVVDDQKTSQAEWRWPDGAVVLLAQPDNQIFLSYSEISPSHETVTLTKQELNSIRPGSAIRVQWPLNGGIWIVRRSQEAIRALSDHVSLADPSSLAPPTALLKIEAQAGTPLATEPYIHTEQRSINAEFGIFREMAPLEGCSVKFVDGSSAAASAIPVIAQLGDHWHGGFYDVCKNVAFDMAGRAYKNAVGMPNLMVPEYSFGTDGRLVIGNSPSK